MRRKSERTASKKSKPSPEKKEKVEKAKHSRSRRRKQSSSSESTEEPPPVLEGKSKSEIVETKVPEAVSTKEDNSIESEDQVWQVKSTEGSGDVGEIQKLKLCLARPPSTPERVDRSPRSRRKHARATSSSDNQSVEGDDKKKSRHRSKRHSESKDIEKHVECDKTEAEMKDVSLSKPLETETIQSGNQNITSTVETPVSTTTEEIKSVDKEHYETERAEEKPEEEKATETEAINDTEDQDKTSDADTITTFAKLDNDEEQKENITLPSGENQVRKRSLSAEKSEILELHAEDSQCETSEVSFSESQDAKSKTALDEDKDVSNFVPNEVSINKSTTEISGQPGSNSKEKITTNNSEDKLTHNNSEDTITCNSVDRITPNSSEEKITSNSEDLASNTEGKISPSNSEDKKTLSKNDEGYDKIVETESTTTPDSILDGSTDVNPVTATQTNEENSQTTPSIPNGEVTPLVVNRKRRWGSRPSKLSTQKSITISTDVLKEIIPDVRPAEFDEVIQKEVGEKKHKRIGVPEKIDRPILPKITIDNTDIVEISKKDKKTQEKDSENVKGKETNLALTRKISIVKDHDSIIARPPSPPRHKQSSILYITNLVRPFTLPQLKNLLQRTGKIVENGFWIDRIKSKCYVKYDTEDQAVETRHALHGVTWPVSNPKTLHVDFSTLEDFDKAKANEETDNAKVSTIPGTVEDWLREQDMKREKGELDKVWERKAAMREWDVGKNEKTKEVIRLDKNHKDERREPEKRRHRTIERSPEPARKFKKKEEEAPAKLLDDLFRKTKATPCIYWLPLSAETIAVKEEQRRQHMAEHERRLQELRRTHRRH